MHDLQQLFRGMLRKAAVLVVLAIMVALPARLLAKGDECDGVHMPSQITVAGKTLVRNGMGIRRATIFNVHVYVAALYVEKPSHSAAELLRGGQIRSLTMRFVRDVSREEMTDAVAEGIRKNAPREAGAVKQEMLRLEKLLPPLHEGNVLTFRHVPGQGLAILDANKVLGTVESDVFASLMFRIWLGPQPPDDDLKAGLLGAPCD